MLRHRTRRAPHLADLANARRQQAADRPAVVAVGHGDEQLVPDDWADSEPLPAAENRATRRAARKTARSDGSSGPAPSTRPQQSNPAPNAPQNDPWAVEPPF